MYSQLLGQFGDDVRGGVFADVLAGHEDDPESSAIPLRLLGGLHRLVRDGRALQLRCGGPPPHRFALHRRRSEALATYPFAIRHSCAARCELGLAVSWTK
jgi:hypothetical protein